MKKPFRRGLVVGKFAPLHKGHELLIRRALDACDDVILLSYCNPEPACCPPELREQWLTTLFPTARRLVVTAERLAAWLPRGVATREIPANDAADSEHQTFCGFLCRHVLDTTVDAVFTSEDYGRGFARELTGYFRKWEPATSRVRHVLVDRARALVPITGSRLREDVHAGRHWLAPEVYASFVERVCLLGGESSGKTTLARALARALDTACVPEYGRELWEAKSGALEYGDLLRIAEEQVAREDRAAQQANHYLICDTSPLTTLLYSRSMFARVDPALERLANRAYRLVVLCEPGFAFVQDGTRQDESFRAQQHAWYMEELEARGIPYLVVSGDVEERVARIREELGA